MLAGVAAEGAVQQRAQPWGPNAHRKWHYVREGQPPFFVKWFIRFRLWGYVTIAQDLWTRPPTSRKSSVSSETD